MTESSDPAAGDAGGRFRLRVFPGLAAWRARGEEPDPGGRGGQGDPVTEAVAGIVARVRREGDAALLALAREFDGADLDRASLRVPPEELADLAAGADADDRALLRRARDRIRDYHRRQEESSFSLEIGGGAVLEWRVLPLASVGVYVPGGAAVYPSTVLMNTVPAAVAGVPRIALATPPGALERSPALAAAVEIAGVSEVYRVGGAQAVAALAFGTETVAPVLKVVGPGNAWVAEAKRQVGAFVGVDSPAGPSELVVLGDGSARPDWIAADLLAQAEHGSGDERVILVTTSATEAEAVAAALAEQAPGQPHEATIARALARRGAAVVVGDLDEAVAVAEEIAPEHLQVMTAAPDRLADRLGNAGSVLLGGYAPTAATDYGLGPNHVLPTGGAARFASALGVPDFRRRQSRFRGARETLSALREDFERFARLEGFEAHARSVSIRFADEGLDPNAGAEAGNAPPATGTDAGAGAEAAR